MPRSTRLGVILVLAGSLSGVAWCAPAGGTGIVDHVTYLASPELKGRKPLSRGFFGSTGTQFRIIQDAGIIG